MYSESLSYIRVKKDQEYCQTALINNAEHCSYTNNGQQTQPWFRYRNVQHCTFDIPARYFEAACFILKKAIDNLIL